MPLMRAQKLFLRAAAFGDRFACFAETGRFKFMPWAQADLRPASFKPPLGLLPALRCQAGDLATI